MPSLTVPQLAVTLSGTNVTINVTYTAVFTLFELFLAANGLIFREEIRIIGEDPGVGTDVVLHTLPIENVSATSSGAPRSRSITVSRQSLQEDIGSDNDEITCEVTVTPIGLPTRRIVRSAEQTLAG